VPEVEVLDHSRATVDMPPVAGLSADVSQPMRPYMPAAAAEMMTEIPKLVPEYSRPTDSPYGRRMRWVINETVRHFVAAIGDERHDWEALREIYAGIGAHQARKGRSLDGLQTAIRVCGQVASRRFIRDARRLHWSLDTLSRINDALFDFLEQIASAATEGYAAATEQLADERERVRARLRDLLVCEPAVGEEAITALARRAGWDVPRTIALVAMRRLPDDIRPVLPPTVLADWSGPEPYMLVPDPEGPGRRALLAALTEGFTAAIGPTVPLAQGAVSLRWARRLLGLIGKGLVPGRPAARCLDHVPTIVTALSEELVGFAMMERLRPLLELKPHRRRLYARTLLEYMKAHDNAVITAERLMVHEQTVRYRIRRLEALLGEMVHDPGCRAELLLVLIFAVEFGRLCEAPSQPATSPAGRSASGDQAAGAVA
jgi:hypothetical protein